MSDSNSSSAATMRLALMAAGTAVACCVAYLAYRHLAGNRAPEQQAASSSSSSTSSSSSEPAKTAPATSSTSSAKADGGAATKSYAAAAAKAPTTADIEAKAAEGPLNTKDAKALAATYKKMGNKLYTSKKPREAVEFYTKAIDVYPDDDKDKSVFYCNRAACHVGLSNWRDVIEDCTAALAIQPHYNKALHRRAVAYERVNSKELALQDYVRLCLIQPQANPNQPSEAVVSMTRVVRELAGAEAKRILESKPPGLIPATTITQYLDGFVAQEDPEPESAGALTAKIAKSPDDGMLYYRRARANVQAQNYAPVLADAETAVKKLKAAKASDQDLIKALLLEGTFLHMNGRQEDSIPKYDEILDIDPKCYLAKIKRGSAHLDSNRIDLAMADYDAVAAKDPTNRDVYYHRGQLLYLTQDLKRARDDFVQATKRNKESYAPLLQLAVTHLTLGDVNSSLKGFEAALERFPNCSLAHMLFGQILLESLQLSESQGTLTEALLHERLKRAREEFEVALRLDPKNANALANKAHLMLRMAQIDDFIKLTKEAIKIDPECEQAYTQLAQYLFQQGETDEAIELFSKAIELSRALESLTAACEGRIAATAQKIVLESDAVLKKKVEDQAREVRRQMEAMKKRQPVF